MRSEMQHVGQEQRERLVAHDLARADIAPEFRAELKQLLGEA